MTSVWWVNQSKRKGAADNETIWAPKADARGMAPHHWARLLEVQPGDIIYHFTSSELVGVSRATSQAVTSDKPYDYSPIGRVTARWGDLGNRIPIDYSPFDIPVGKNEIDLKVRLDNRSPEGPFDKNGDVVQGYFFPVSNELFAEIARLTGLDYSVSGVDSPAIVGPELRGPTDSVAAGLVRREQPIIRQRLISGRRELPCGICGELTPSDYLVAGHIKKRSSATEKERRDPHIAMLVCVFGCDKAFEIGDVRVASGGVMSVSSRLRLARPEFAAKIDGGIAPAYSAENERFFASRNKSFLG